MQGLHDVARGAQPEIGQGRQIILRMHVARLRRRPQEAQRLGIIGGHILPEGVQCPHHALCPDMAAAGRGFQQRDAASHILGNPAPLDQHLASQILARTVAGFRHGVEFLEGRGEITSRKGDAPRLQVGQGRRGADQHERQSQGSGRGAAGKVRHAGDIRRKGCPFFIADTGVLDDAPQTGFNLRPMILRPELRQMAAKKNPLNLNPLQLKTLTLFQALAEFEDITRPVGDGAVEVMELPFTSHGNHFHLGPWLVYAQDATGLRNIAPWTVLERKGLIIGNFPMSVTLTREGLEYETGMRRQILQGSDH